MNEQYTHIDLFTGLAGFSLAARANGIRTIQFVEIDQRCRNFLARAWPGIPIHDDIKTFHWDMAKSASQQCDAGAQAYQPVATGHDRQKQFANNPGGSVPNDRVFLLTAGVPCQPASRAGKQRGAADDRWLWPDAIRVLGEVQPTWAIFENPPGIGDVGLAGILSDVESKGYEVRVFSIPACAVGAPHGRERYYIVAHTCRQGHTQRGMQPGISSETGQTDQGQAVDMGGQKRMGDTECVSVRRRRKSIGNQAGPRGRGDRSVSRCQWNRFVWLPCADGKVRRAPDDTFGLVDGLHRSVLAALGNSIVPQVAEKIIQAIILSELSSE